MKRLPLYRRTRARRWPFRLIALALVGYFAGLVWFAATLATEETADRRTTDAIVVLTGGSLRVQAGFQLLEAGLARQLLVSGVNREVERNELLAFAPLRKDLMTCCVTLGYAAGDTIGNASETAAWAMAHDVHSLRLVTANYHMPRAILELKRSLPDADILPYPVFPAAFDLRRPTLAATALLFSEYNKLLGAWGRHLLASGMELLS
ncbi:YdcF family protein [Lacibacterium aquatile]|uniref:YdcF family protein n=1 Tax=Lacibacterium aquatile TaxID=1168082 RepID=A0ABW5DU51_9PROT